MQGMYTGNNGIILILCIAEGIKRTPMLDWKDTSHTRLIHVFVLCSTSVEFPSVHDWPDNKKKNEWDSLALLVMHQNQHEFWCMVISKTQWVPSICLYIIGSIIDRWGSTIWQYCVYTAVSELSDLAYQAYGKMFPDCLVTLSGSLVHNAYVKDDGKQFPHELHHKTGSVFLDVGLVGSACFPWRSYDHDWDIGFNMDNVYQFTSDQQGTY